MIVLEYCLQQCPVKWLKMKVYDEKEIAVGCYMPAKKNVPICRKRKITVAVFAPAVGIMGEETVVPIDGTVRKFRKKDRKIANWYFRELCRLYKNGIANARDETREFSVRFE
jgi:hypothetical protein